MSDPGASTPGPPQGPPLPVPLFRVYEAPLNRGASTPGPPRGSSSVPNKSML